MAGHFKAWGDWFVFRLINLGRHVGLCVHLLSHGIFQDLVCRGGLVFEKIGLRCLSHNEKDYLEGLKFRLSLKTHIKISNFDTKSKSINCKIYRGLFN